MRFFGRIIICYMSRTDNKTLLSQNCREFYQQQKNVTYRYALYLLILYKKVRIWRGTEKEIHHKFVSGKWRRSYTAGKYQAYTAETDLTSDLFNQVSRIDANNFVVPSTPEWKKRGYLPHHLATGHICLLCLWLRSHSLWVCRLLHSV